MRRLIGINLPFFMPAFEKMGSANHEPGDGFFCRIGDKWRQKIKWRQNDSKRGIRVRPLTR